MRLSILHTNDFHGKLTPEIAATIASTKSRLEPCLYFDSGDAITAGNLAIPVKPDSAWPLLSSAGCDASVPGNRESHVMEPARKAKFEGSSHPIVCANWWAKKASLVFDSHIILEPVAGFKVGVLGVMVPMVTANMTLAGASAFLWTSPIEAAIEIASDLRGEVDLVVALTHIGLGKDQELAATTQDIDIILGGHTHTVLEQPLLVNKTWICQGGSHGRYLGVYTWENEKLSGGLQSLVE